MSVDTPDKNHQAHADDWELASDLWGGTKTMIEAGARRAPQFPKETDVSYKLRIGGAVLFNTFKRTVGMLTGKAFQHPITLEDNIPPKIAPYLENVDREGTHIDLFARNTFEMGVRDGARFIFIDMPRKPEGGVRLDEERALLMRPYWVDVDARKLIGVRKIVVGGRRILSQIRMREEGEREVSEFETACVNRVRVVDAAPRDEFGAVLPESYTSYRIFEEIEDSQTKEKEWRVVEEGQMKPLVDIPLVAFLPRQEGFMCGEMVLRDLADLNVTHWRSDSDQRHILHKARVPVGVLAGFNIDGPGGGLVEVASSNWLVSSDSTAKAYFMEHSGAAITAGREDLTDLENRMRVMGLELLVDQPGDVTATARALDQASSDSELAKMVRTMEDATEEALTFTALWEGAAIEDAKSGELHGGSVTIVKDYAALRMAPEERTFLLEMKKAGTLSTETLLTEVKRRGTLSDDLDVEEELTRIEDETEMNPPFDPTAPPPNEPVPNKPANEPTPGDQVPL